MFGKQSKAKVAPVVKAMCNLKTPVQQNPARPRKRAMNLVEQVQTTVMIMMIVMMMIMIMLIVMMMMGDPMLRC